jgi:hypothetical protein
VTAHAAAILDTSIIAALKLYDPSELPGTILITAIELDDPPRRTDGCGSEPVRVQVEESVSELAPAGEAV